MEKREKEPKKSYPEIMIAVIDMSDIVLEVLDARFINETRDPEIEEMIKRKGKALIYVINKADIASPASIYRNSAGLYPKVIFSCKSREGKSALRRAILIEIKKKKLEDAFVGVIGYPNTGKSSVINFLRGKKSAGVSSVSGYTKGMMKVRVHKKFRLIDTPGVIPMKEYAQREQKHFKLAIIGVRVSADAKNPELIVDKLRKAYPGVIEKFYNIQGIPDTQTLLETIAQQHHMLLKGAELDTDRAARHILKNWQNGKIRPD